MPKAVGHDRSGLDGIDINDIIGWMAQLIVRNLEEELVRRLKRRAGEHGRSTEAEHREILRAALLGPRPQGTLKDLLEAMPSTGTDRDFAPRRGRVRGVRL